MTPEHKDRRNPYLVLGLPYGASKKEVRKGFAKRARDIKSGKFTVYRNEDLNWALHQLELAEKDPELDIDNFRAPANQILFDGDNDLGFFNPEIQSLSQKTSELPKSEIQNIIDQAVVEWVSVNFADVIKNLRLPYPTPIKEK